MKVSTILGLPTARVILFLNSKNEARYSELVRLIPSRGTLSLSLKELENEELINREVLSSRPIRVNYSLTPKGKEIGAHLKEISQLLDDKWV